MICPLPKTSNDFAVTSFWWYEQKHQAIQVSIGYSSPVWILAFKEGLALAWPRLRPLAVWSVPSLQLSWQKAASHQVSCAQNLTSLLHIWEHTTRMNQSVQWNVIYKGIERCPAEFCGTFCIRLLFFRFSCGVAGSKNACIFSTSPRWHDKEQDPGQPRERNLSLEGFAE